MAVVLKTTRHASVSGVRIPHAPPALIQGKSLKAKVKSHRLIGRLFPFFFLLLVFSVLAQDREQRVEGASGSGVRDSLPAPRTPLTAPRPSPTAPLRAALQDLSATFGAAYPKGAEFLGRLDSLEKSMASERAEDAAKAKAGLAALQREALIANPLVSDSPLLFVVRAQYRPDHHNSETMFQTGEINTGSFTGPGWLKTIDLKTGKVTTLVHEPNGIARDPEVHWDGKKIIFSMRHKREDDYHLYEINADGTRPEATDVRRRASRTLTRSIWPTTASCSRPRANRSTACATGTSCATSSSHGRRRRPTSTRSARARCTKPTAR